MLSVLIFLAAIVAANLSVAHFGPVSTPFNAFFLIALDLTLRDSLHEKWKGRSLGLKMLALIAVGAVITYAMNSNAGRIGIASVAAFAAASTVDFSLYQLFYKRRWIEKANYSNIGGGLTDSVLFPTIAFGMFMPWVIIAQFAAKTVGGFLWSLVIAKMARGTNAVREA